MSPFDLPWHLRIELILIQDAVSSQKFGVILVAFNRKIFFVVSKAFPKPTTRGFKQVSKKALQTTEVF